MLTLFLKYYKNKIMFNMMIKQNNVWMDYYYNLFTAFLFVFKNYLNF